jgi:hypothetical protein
VDSGAVAACGGPSDFRGSGGRAEGRKGKRVTEEG